MRAGNILIVYGLLQHPLRSAIKDHLYSFRRYAGGRCVYLNMHARSVPRWVLRTHFDAVVFHTTFLSQRWHPHVFERLRQRARPLLGVGDVRVALPQDEFLHTDLLCEFIEEFDVDRVFSVAPPSEWPKIYAGVDRERVRFSEALTGYLEADTVMRIDRIVAETGERPIAIGYRAWEGAPWLGRHGMLKRTVGEEFERAATERGIATDISTREEDALSGDDWFRFLARCRYTVGVEGGATVLDRDGSFKARTEAYLREHPGATYEQVEEACFPGADGELALLAVSPRHLEACATRTCQVLVEGSYSGVLQAGTHYIPLRRDLSDVQAALHLIQSDSERERITEAAYRDVVASGRYSYAGFVAEVERAIAEDRVRLSGDRGQAGAPAGGSGAALGRALAGPADTASWLQVILAARVAPRLAPAVKRVLPARAYRWLARRLYPTSTSADDG